jgi:mannose-6-phosphate isomerase
LSQGNINGRDVVITDLLKEPDTALSLFGPEHTARHNHSPEILVKLLDSKIRLPLQTHPDRTFAKKHLNSSYGKTECWIILGGREIEGDAPHVYFGFKENVRKAEFDESYHKQDVTSMVNSLNKVYVKPGDVFVIPGNLIHAIGPGVFLVEIQEPSDHVFQLDRKGPCWELNDFQTHMGLGDKAMLDSFDYSIKGDEIFRRYCSCFDVNGTKESRNSILPESFSRYFRSCFVTAYDLTRELSSFAIGIVVSGSGEVECVGGSLEVQQGDTFMLPFDARHVRYRSASGHIPLHIIESLPPI